MDKKLWMQAQQLARQSCIDIYGEEWDELGKYQREDCVWSEYEKLLKEKEKRDMSTKLVCPNCGTEMKLPEKSSLAIGMTLSKETVGTHVLQADVIRNNNVAKEMVNMNSREGRMVALNIAGVNTEKYFDVKLPNGDTVKMTMNADGVPVVVTGENEVDPIMEQIMEDGYVKNTKLYRRFVMAQMFHMLDYHSYRTGQDGFDAALKDKGYYYQFKMMLEEIRVISKLETRDKEAFDERTHFFNKRVVVDVCTDYLLKLKEYAEAKPTKNCKGTPYIRIKGRDVFVEDLQKKVYYPVEQRIRRIGRCENYTQIYNELKRFMKEMVQLPWNTKLSKDFVDAYKGNGGYYTLLNLIKYHNCLIYTKMGYYKGNSAVDYVQSFLDVYCGQGWRYMAMLKKCIADNNFDFKKRMQEIYSEN